MSDQIGRATAKLQGLEAKLSVVETDAEYATLALSSSWQHHFTNRGAEDASLRNIEKLLSDGWRLQERMMSDLHHRFANRINRFCAKAILFWMNLSTQMVTPDHQAGACRCAEAMQRIDGSIAMTKGLHTAKQNRIEQDTKVQTQRGGGWGWSESRSAEEELRGEVARLADVNAQLSRKLSAALKAKMENDRLHREHARLQEKEAAMEEMLKDMQHSLQTMRRREKETEGLEAELVWVKTQLSAVALEQKSDGQVEDTTFLNFRLLCLIAFLRAHATAPLRGQVQRLMQELNVQAELVSRLRVRLLFCLGISNLLNGHCQP